VGQDIHRQLFNDPQLTYGIHYQYIAEGDIQIAGITVILVRHMEGFLLLSGRNSPISL
jgi:hypothetical protein